MTIIANIDTSEDQDRSATAAICDSAALYGATPEPPTTRRSDRPPLRRSPRTAGRVAPGIRAGAPAEHRPHFARHCLMQCAPPRRPFNRHGGSTARPATVTIPPSFMLPGSADIDR